MNKKYPIFPKVHIDQVWWISNVEDLLSIHSFIQILDITVDNEAPNTSLPNSIEFKYGRSIHYNIISTIPLITNEEQKKLDESYPISPILIVDNLGRFLNSNPSA